MMAQDEEVRKQKKLAKRRREEIRVPMRFLRESIKMLLAASGKNVTNFDKKTIKLISPRFLSLVPDQNDDDLVNQHPIAFPIFSTSRRCFLPLSGVTDAVDQAEDTQAKLRERELLNENGVPLYFTKKNVTEILGDTEKRKIETFETLDKSYTVQQKEDLGRDGYAFLDAEQLRTVYGPN
ncbi:hypothetical protein OESDEN_18691, partial [Oesophagostomum dentatum]